MLRKLVSSMSPQNTIALILVITASWFNAWHPISHQLNKKCIWSLVYISSVPILQSNRWISIIEMAEFCADPQRRFVTLEAPNGIENIHKILVKARCTTVIFLFVLSFAERSFRRGIKWLSNACLHSSSSLSCQKQVN